MTEALAPTAVCPEQHNNCVVRELKSERVRPLIPQAMGAKSYSKIITTKMRQPSRRETKGSGKNLNVLTRYKIHREQIELMNMSRPNTALSR